MLPPSLFTLEIDTKRIYGLDILRAFAIIAVMITHSGGFVPISLLTYNDFLAFDGVGLFFVLSGFLIGGILINILANKVADRYALINFWLKRWIRTLPPYFVILSIVIILNSSNPTFKFNYFKTYFIFLQNLFTPHLHFFEESWSLAVEEWFYIIIPILINLFSMKSIWAIPIVSISIILVVTFYRYYKFLHLPINNVNDWEHNFRKIVVTRLDNLMYGVISAYTRYYFKNMWENNIKIKFILGIIFIFIGKLPPNYDSFGVYSCVFSFSITSFGVMLLLPFLYHIKSGKGIIYNIILRISIISRS